MKYTPLLPLFLLLPLACHKDTEVILWENTIPDPPVFRVTTRLVTMIDTTYPGALQSQLRFNDQWTGYGPLPFTWSGPSYTDRSYATILLRTPDGHEFHAVQSLAPNDVNYHHWSIPNLESVTSHSQEELYIQLTSEAGLILPPGRFMTSDSVTYHGSYTLAYASLYPQQDVGASIPSHTAMTRDAGPASLLFKHCLYLRLTGSHGEPLLISGDAYLAFAGPVGDGWSFDAEKGCWVPAHVKGGDKILLHRSGYFAAASPAPVTHLGGVLKINNTPSPHTTIAISYQEQSRTIYTTNTGAWSLQLPSGISATARVPISTGDTLEQAFDTPVIPESTLDLLYTSPDLMPAMIDVTIRDCAALPLPDNILLVKGVSNGFLFYPEPDIQMMAPLPVVGNIELQALHTATAETGPSVHWPVAAEMDLGAAFACQAAQDAYLMLTVSGERKLYGDLTSSFTPENRLLIEDGGGGTLDFMVYITGALEGNIPDEQLNIRFEDMQLGTKGYSLYCPTATQGCGFSRFTITHFTDTPGEWIRGYFEGTFWIKTFHPLTAGYRPVQGQFQVRRGF